jgi:hypothetical protein
MAPLGDRLLVKPQEEAKVSSGQHFFGVWHLNVVRDAQSPYRTEASPSHTSTISHVQVYTLHHSLLQAKKARWARAICIVQVTDL